MNRLSHVWNQLEVNWQILLTALHIINFDLLDLMCEINRKILEPGRHVILMKKLGEVII